MTKEKKPEDYPAFLVDSNFAREVLTKRELFAAMAMQALLSYGGAFSMDSKDYGAILAVEHADALIKALEE